MEKNSNYHRRLLVETSFSRYQPLVGSRLSLRDYHAQVGEMLAGAKLLNKLTSLGSLYDKLLLKSVPQEKSFFSTRVAQQRY